MTSVEVFKLIKQLSRRTLGTHQRILLSEIASELLITQDKLLVLLIELENRGLVKIHKTRVLSVSITDYGHANETPPGGLGSE